MAAIYLNNFNAEAQGSRPFEPEYFAALSPKATYTGNFPVAELLYRPRNGQNPEEFFGKARAAGKVVEADLAVFELAIDEHMHLGFPVSINLNAETFFDKRLLGALSHVKRKHPTLDPKNIWLEVTEQGGVPATFNHHSLEFLKDLKYKLALDDYNPHDPEEERRLALFAPHVQAIKMPFQVIEELKMSISMNTMRSIQTARRGQDDTLLVMEGYRESEHEGITDVLTMASIDVIQHSSFVPKTQKPQRPVDTGITYAHEFAYCG